MVKRTISNQNGYMLFSNLHSLKYNKKEGLTLKIYEKAGFRGKPILSRGNKVDIYKDKQKIAHGVSAYHAKDILYMIQQYEQEQL